MSQDGAISEPRAGIAARLDHLIIQDAGYFPELLSKAYLAAIEEMASDGDIEPSVAAAATGTDICDWPKETIPRQELEDEVSWVIDGADTTELADEFLNGTEVAGAGDPLLGGMNSGSETTLFTIERGGRIFSYVTESEGLGEGWMLTYEHDTGDAAGQAAFRGRVRKWLAPYWGNNECYLVDIDDDDLTVLRREAAQDPWESGVTEDYLRRPTDTEREALRRTLQEEQGLSYAAAGGVLGRLLAGRVDYEDEAAQNAAWWIVEQEMP